MNTLCPLLPNHIITEDIRQFQNFAIPQRIAPQFIRKVGDVLALEKPALFRNRPLSLAFDKLSISKSNL